MSNKMFDILRLLCEVILPAISALYWGLAEIWNFPMPEKVVGTIAVLITFLGSFINIKRTQYNDLMNQ